MFKLLYPALVERAHDKEPTVRAQAVIALNHLLTHSEGVEEHIKELTEVILDVMSYDPAS